VQFVLSIASLKGKRPRCIYQAQQRQQPQTVQVLQPIEFAEAQRAK